jgi:hypothetical protein
VDALPEKRAEQPLVLELYGYVCHEILLSTGLRKFLQTQEVWMMAFVVTLEK